jgi:hypothetical protein
MVMLDDNGDENYQPMLIPLEGGLPQPAFGETFANYRVHYSKCDAETNRVYLVAESRLESVSESYRCNLETGEVHKLFASPWFGGVDAVNTAHDQAIIIDGYTSGDHVLYRWDGKQTTVLYGVPMEERSPSQSVALNGIHDCQFIDEDRSLLFVTTLFEDTGGPAALLSAILIWSSQSPSRGRPTVAWARWSAWISLRETVSPCSTTSMVSPGSTKRPLTPPQES